MEGHGLQIYKNAIKCKDVIDIEHKFTCLASLSALIRYLEHNESMYLSPQAIKIDYYYLEHITHIDYKSCLKLELLLNLQFETEANSLLSLFETNTIGGKRLLRMNILHPLSNSTLISKRVEVVEELLSNETLLVTLVDLLPNFKEFELYTGKFSQGLKNDSMPYIKSLVSKKYLYIAGRNYI